MARTFLPLRRPDRLEIISVWWNPASSSSWLHGALIDIFSKLRSTWAAIECVALSHHRYLEHHPTMKLSFIFHLQLRRGHCMTWTREVSHHDKISAWRKHEVKVSCLGQDFGWLLEKHSFRRSYIRLYAYWTGCVNCCTGNNKVVFRIVEILSCQWRPLFTCVHTIRQMSVCCEFTGEIIATLLRLLRRTNSVGIRLWAFTLVMTSLKFLR